MFITKAGQNTTHKTCICTHLLRACTFAHCDEELQASNHNASIDLAELGDREAYEPDLAIDQGVVVSAVPAARRGPGAPVRVSRLRPLQFELHGSIFTPPAPHTSPLNNDNDFVYAKPPEERECRFS